MLKKNNNSVFASEINHDNHLQRKTLHDWLVATDEQHLQSIRKSTSINNTDWMLYLERHRPHVVKEFLKQRKKERSAPGFQ